jgi:hypothetical protein
LKKKEKKFPLVCVHNNFKGMLNANSACQERLNTGGRILQMPAADAGDAADAGEHASSAQGPLLRISQNKQITINMRVKL